MRCDVFFFPNGNTAVCHDGQQVFELQKSWLVHFAEFLENHDVEIMGSTFVLPNGNVAQFFLADHGLSWQVAQKVNQS